MKKKSEKGYKYNGWGQAVVYRDENNLLEGISAK